MFIRAIRTRGVFALPPSFSSTTMASMHRTPNLLLPNETLVAIFDGLDPTALADISRVSRRFNAVAERLLYSFISITDLLSSSSPIPAKTLRCCQSILQRPHLIEAMKRLQIRWVLLQGDFRVLSPQALIEACAEAGIALQKLAFLEGLDVFLGPSNLATSPLQPIHAIELIVRGSEWSRDVQPYTSILSELLTLVPSLRHLKLSDHRAALSLPPDALPSLSYFRGSPNTAAILLPGRPVQHLALVGQDSDVNRENLPKMALTSIPLRSLDLSAMQVRPTLLRNISTYLAAIESLKVRLALRHTLHYALSGIIDGNRQANFAEDPTLCTAWIRACPTLKRIVFPSGTQWQVDENGVGRCDV
ncbi:hypothetical protein B0H14DRAFT_2689828 [Mycena olivaceomarginata]|nr:hypothetical protein B0H14DRAFT_2689828 [Mycena olivaceomarginata]